MNSPTFYLVDAFEVLTGIDATLNNVRYPDNQNVRALVRSYCLKRALEEILLVESIPRIAYLEHAYHLVKNTYAMVRGGFTLGLLEDVNTICLQRAIQSTHFEYSPNFDVRGRWLVARINKSGQ